MSANSTYFTNTLRYITMSTCQKHQRHFRTLSQPNNNPEIFLNWVPVSRQGTAFNKQGQAQFYFSQGSRNVVKRGLRTWLGLSISQITGLEMNWWRGHNTITLSIRAYLYFTQIIIGLHLVLYLCLNTCPTCLVSS